MDAIVKPFEQLLAPLFKNLPALPENGKKALVKYWPVLALIFGVLQILAVFALWQLGHAVSAYLSVAMAYGSVASTLGFFYYLGLVVLAVDAVILFMAYAPLKAHSRKGWDLLFFGSLLNLLYGIVIIFDGAYGGLDKLVGSLLGSAVAFYLLFQVSEYYMGKAKTAKPSNTATPDRKPE
jgi:hypothetical protein